MLKLSNITKKYYVANTTVEALKGINLSFRDNEFVAILGPSGCGKTTLLNIISGVVKNDESDFKGIEDLGVSYIFQDDRLIDWLSVEDNIKLVIKKHYSEDKVNELCEKYLKLVGIYEYKNYYP